MKISCVVFHYASSNTSTTSRNAIHCFNAVPQEAFNDAKGIRESIVCPKIKVIPYSLQNFPNTMFFTIFNLHILHGPLPAYGGIENS